MTHSLKKTVQKHREAAPRRNITQEAAEIYEALRDEFENGKGPSAPHERWTWHVEAPFGRPLIIRVETRDGKMYLDIHVTHRTTVPAYNNITDLKGWVGPRDPRRFAREFKQEVQNLITGTNNIENRLRSIFDPLGGDVGRDSRGKFYVSFGQGASLDFRADGSLQYCRLNVVSGGENMDRISEHLKNVSRVLIALKAMKNAGFDIDLPRELDVASDYLQELL